jgi:hypothetical protein
MMRFPFSGAEVMADNLKTTAFDFYGGQRINNPVLGSGFTCPSGSVGCRNPKDGCLF